jgi:methylated-DNA-[protein]-cysteine S-methyltransferase
MPAATTSNTADAAPPPGARGFALFDTPIGRCALVWRGEAVAGAALPEDNDARLRARVMHRFAGAQEAEPPAFARATMRRVFALLSGAHDDLADLALDLEGVSPFEASVYAATRRIRPGEVRTYGAVASEVGAPGAAQAVGMALGRNPIPIIVPCHRVLGGAGKSGGFSAPGGTGTKFRMLEIEGARRPEDGGLFDALPLRIRPA